MTERVFNVLFLCTCNSARSIPAETVLTKLDAMAIKRKVRESAADAARNGFHE